MISKKYLSKLALPAVLLLATIGIVSCSEDEPIIGSDLLKKDRIGIDSDSGLSFNAYTISDNSFLPKEVNSLLAGDISSSDFGRSKAGFAAQLRLGGTSSLDTLQVDSAFVVLYFNDLVGDSLANQRIHVYEIDETLDFEKDYPKSYRPALKREIASMDFNKSMINVLTKRVVKEVKDTANPYQFETLVNGEVVVKDTVELPILVLDTVSTQLQLRIPLNQEIIDHFKNAANSNYSSSDAFLNFFKGIYVETEALSGTGSVYSFRTIIPSSYGNLYSGIRFYLSDPDDEKTETEYYADEDGDGVYSAKTFLSTPEFPNDEFGFNIQDFSIRLNRFEHDQTGAAIEEFFNNTEEEDDVVYAQGMLGTKIKVQAEGLNEYLEEQGKIAINKASLRLSVADTVDIPSRLEIFALDDEGNEIAIPDSEISLSLVNGFYNSEAKEYVFNIQNYLQDIVNNADKVDNGLIIRPAFSNSNARSVIIENPKEGDENEDKRIKLTITYTKL